MATAIRYFLRHVIEGSENSLEIEHEDYSELLNAEDQLDHVLSVEDKYDVTIQNYLEFETSVVQEAVRDLVSFCRERH